MPYNKIDRFRGWAVAALYTVLGLFTLLLFMSGIMLFDNTAASLFFKVTFLCVALISTFSAFRSSYHFIHVMRANIGIPALHALPFLCVAITLLLAGIIFSPT